MHKYYTIVMFMNLNLNIRDVTVKKLKEISCEIEIEFDELVNNILEEGLADYDEDRIFEERTRKALEHMENDTNRRWLTAEEFLKELESW